MSFGRPADAFLRRGHIPAPTIWLSFCTGKFLAFPQAGKCGRCPRNQAFTITGPWAEPWHAAFHFVERCIFLQKVLREKMGCEDVGYLCPDNALKPLNTDLSAPLQQACHGCRMYAE
jgi:hypothetical protein